MAAESQRLDATFDKEGRRRLVAIAGFSLAYTVCVSFFYSSWLAGRPDFPISAFDNVLNPSIFLGSIAFSLIAFFASPSRRAMLAVIGFAAFAAAIVGMAIASSLGAADAAFVASVIAAGVGMSFVMPSYFWLFAPCPPRMIAIACGTMSLGGMIAGMVIDLLPFSARLVMYAACLAGSIGCFVLALQGRSKRSVAESASSIDTPRATPKLSRLDFLDAFLVPGVCTFALSVVYGIVDTAATNGSFSFDASLRISQFGGIAAAVAFLLYFGRPSTPSPSMLFNVVFGVLATGILFLPFLPEEYAVSLNILAAAGWKLVMLSLLFLVATTYLRDGKRLLAGVSLAYALPRLGLFIGQNIAWHLGIGSTADFVRMVAVAFFLLYLVLMVIWMANSHERKKAEKQARAADELLDRISRKQHDAQEARCYALASEHGLTNRERDILILLAQGRDLAFICEKLFLSKNTVKSYQKTIYAKLDVHSKQEIIDLAQG
ncbi:helix-turn-helix transcriptional regulator [Gordonibacter sp. An230]|uniref:helix-turn-helix transcriptional regulator n=1 Tax=Gordonibacter sp. An230 TaxID=1965592 RepID=UPI000B39C21D|nr:LuxR family transcriptional regulator [Gordonibacter sp. An230]OUO89524.1 helix-turn-helix transcriptional regulator [Gordonibacter sp. An230]